MADDKEELYPRTITFRQYKFSLREIILAALVLLGVVFFLLFAGLYGKTSSDLQAANSKLSSVKPQCANLWCLETSAHAETFLNKSSDPCDNFYQFACGGYKVARQLDPGRDLYLSVLQELYQNNIATLEDILVSGRLPKNLNRSSSERKLKEFYSSCVDDFTREQLKGKPLLNKIYPLMGGSYLTDPQWNPASWNFSAALIRTQTDLYVDALFSPRVRVDQTNSSRRVIAIYPGGTGKFLRWRDYTSVNPTDKQKKLQKDYKTFIRTVATLITRDAGVNRDNSLTNRIDVFVDDVFKVESKIATFASNSRYQRDAFSEAQKIALDDLKGRTNNVIDWTLQMSYLFNQAGVTGNTKVVVPYPTYLGNLSAIIQNLPARNRMLHNYLTWRVLERYVQDLSWEYVHANRQLFVDKYGYQNFLGTQKYCFTLAKRYFNIALGALYVETSFDDRNKKKVTDITETVKTALETMLTKNTWMDQSTKDFAISKMKGSTYKIGYPDFMGQQSKVDTLYEQLNINASDFFGNLLNLNQQHRREWNRQLREGEDRSQWIFNTYDTNMAVYWYWDEIIVPAGILQFPMYTYAMPHYYSFGAIGSLLGHFVHHLIDENGRRWDKGGDFIKDRNGWWSNQTVQNYNAARQCVADVYNNITQGPYYFANGETKTIDVNGDQYAGEAMAVTTGIRLAYNAYQLWQQKHGQDPFPPGLSFTPQQLFFIAHAQVFCYNRDPFYDYIYTLVFRNTNEETRVNVALMELPEFRQAFSCQASDSMVSPRPCTYY